MFVVRKIIRHFSKKKQAKSSSLDLEKGSLLTWVTSDQTRDPESADQDYPDVGQPISLSTIQLSTLELPNYLTEPSIHPPDNDEHIDGEAVSLDDDVDTFITADQRSESSMYTDSCNELQQMDHEMDVVNDEHWTASVRHENIWDFVRDPGSCSVSIISVILACLCREEMCSLYREYGYDKCIVILAIVEVCLVDGACDNVDTVVAACSRINGRRLQDMDYYERVRDNGPGILSMKKELARIMKERTRRYLLCLECRKNTVDILFLPCGHLVVCEQCHRQKAGVCKCCGSRVQESHHVFF